MANVFSLLGCSRQAPQIFMLVVNSVFLFFFQFWRAPFVNKSHEGGRTGGATWTVWSCCYAHTVSRWPCSSRMLQAQRNRCILRTWEGFLFGFFYALSSQLCVFGFFVVSIGYSICLKPSLSEIEMTGLVSVKRIHRSFWLYISVAPWREAVDIWCLPPVWNLKAVIWFHFAVSSLVLLASSVTLSVFFFCLLVHSADFFPENSSVFFIKR